MPISENEIDAVIAGKFVLDCIEMTLVQQIGENPKVYRGPGSITQGENGGLQLKMYHVGADGSHSIADLLDAFSKVMSPGKLISDEHYYSLEARDMSDRVWTESNVWISSDANSEIPGRVIHASLRKIENSSKRIGAYQRTWFNKTVIVLGDSQFPYNKMESTEKRSSRSICHLEVNDGFCEIKERKSHRIIDIRFPVGGNADLQSRLAVEALSVGIGEYLYPLAQFSSSEDQSVISIHSIDRAFSRKRMITPFPARSPHDSKNLEQFVCGYLRRVSENESALFRYWFRVLSASPSELENAALVLTTCIEGILKEYFPDCGVPDEEFLAQVSGALDALKTVEIGPRALSRVQSSLAGAKLASAKGALRDLAERKIIDQRLVSVWSELRNKSAHAGELQRRDQELQDFLDKLYACKELLFILVLHHVGYAGEFIKYSMDGWPVQNFSGSA